jgi:hypothetical protein
MAPTLSLGSKVNWNGEAVEYTGTGKCKYTNRTMAVLKSVYTSKHSPIVREVYFQVEVEDAQRNLITL